jgi:hypothetical protein
MTSPSLKPKSIFEYSHDSLFASKKLGSLLRSSKVKSYESIDKKEKTNENIHVNNEDRRKIPKCRINMESQNTETCKNIDIKKPLPTDHILFKSKDEQNSSKF